MAEFDFKKALKEGIERKKVKEGILLEASRRAAKRVAPDPSGARRRVGYYILLVPEPDSQTSPKWSAPKGCKKTSAHQYVPPAAAKTGKHFAKGAPAPGAGDGPEVPHRKYRCKKDIPGIKKTLDKVGAWYPKKIMGGRRTTYILRAKDKQAAAFTERPLEMTPELMVLKQDVLRDVKKFGAPKTIALAESQELFEGPRRDAMLAARAKKKAEKAAAAAASDDAKTRERMGLPTAPAAAPGVAPAAPPAAKRKDKVIVTYTNKNKKITYPWPGVTPATAKQFFTSIKAEAPKAAGAAAPAAAGAGTATPGSKTAEKKLAKIAQEAGKKNINIVAAYIGKTKEMIVTIVPLKDTSEGRWRVLRNKKQKGIWTKALEVMFADFKQEKPPSFVNLLAKRIIELLAKQIKNFEETGRGAGWATGNPQLEFRIENPEEGDKAKAIINKFAKDLYSSTAEMTFRGVRDLKTKPSEGGAAGFFKKMMGAAGGMSDAGTGEEFRHPSAYKKIPTQESKQIKFADTLAGRRSEKISNMLLNEKKPYDAAVKAWKDADIEPDDGGGMDELAALERSAGTGKGVSRAQAAAVIKNYEKAQAKGGGKGGGIGMDDFLYMHYGDKVAGRILGSRTTQQAAKKAGLTRRVMSGTANKVKASWKWSKNLVQHAGKQQRAIGTFGKGARITKGGQFASRGAQWFTKGGARLGSTAAQAGARTVTGAGLSNLTSVAGATAGQIAGVVLIGAALGTGIGWAINKMISGNLHKDRKKRLDKARSDIKFADYELEVLCTGTGKLCTGMTGGGAPDGWQVKCTGKRGGYKYETGEGGIGYDPGYADPTGGRDRMQHPRGGYDKKDMEDAMMFLSFLWDDDYKNGLVKDHYEEKEKGKSVIGKIELQDGSKLKKWEDCWKRNMEPQAERTLSTSTAEVKKAYKLIQHAYGLPAVSIAFEKGAAIPGAATAAAATGEEGAEKKTKDQERVNKIQSALIKYYGADLQAELGEEFAKSSYGPKTKAKLSEFRAKFRAQMPSTRDPDDFVDFVNYRLEYEEEYGKDYDPAAGAAGLEAAIGAKAAAAAKKPGAPGGVPQKFSPEQIAKYLVSKNLVVSATDPKAKQIIAKLIDAQNKGQPLDFKTINKVASTMLAEHIDAGDIYTKRLLKLNKKVFKIIN